MKRGIVQLIAEISKLDSGERDLLIQVAREFNNQENGNIRGGSFTAPKKRHRRTKAQIEADRLKEEAARQLRETAALPQELI